MMSTPLYKKLNIKSSFECLIINQPEYYFELFDELPEDLVIHFEVEQKAYDFIHFFARSEIDCQELFAKHSPLLRKQGMMWISWPKMSSKIPSDLKRDWIREYVLNEGLVDVKVASINEDWSALKFVFRLKDR